MSREVTSPGSSLWRVRPWIRVVAVVAWLGVLAQQFSVLHFVAIGEMPAGEVRDGFIALAVGALLIGMFAFRSSISVGESRVRLRGPLRTTVFERSDVVEVAPNELGLGFTLRDGTRHTSIVCQDTAVGKPRWPDVAEAVTGRRPHIEGDFTATDLDE